jgi:glutamate synthase domain-containing protein 1
MSTPYMSRYPLYDPAYEHDACGMGFVASISGERSNKILRRALKAVCNVTHRGAVDADEQTGDGAGIMTQIPHKLFKHEVPRLAGLLASDSDLGIGVLFMPLESDKDFFTCKNEV